MEELERWKGGPPVTVTTADDTFVGTYTGTIPAEPFARERKNRRPRLILRRGAHVAYVPTNQVSTITADGRRRPRRAAA